MGKDGKLDIALIGIGNRGAENEMNFASLGMTNVVALCDVDLGARHTQYALAKYPDARRYKDFRRLFDEMSGQLDAVMVAVPDHAHFPICMRAIREGVNVYCEKPVGHTFWENELLIRAARQHPQVVTQMGNQGHTSSQYTQFKLWQDAGIIKNVTHIVAHMNEPRRWHDYDVDITHFPDGQPVPETMDWDTWLGTAQWHEYSDKFHPMNWRGWYDFGTGALGDWGAHLLDTAHRFLRLGLPTEVRMLKSEGHNDFFFPMASTIQFLFPRRGDMPSCDIVWYDGEGNYPPLPEGYKFNPKRPGYLGPGKILYSDSLIFQGGHHEQRLRIIPEEVAVKIRPTLPVRPKDQDNHYENFFRACKGEVEARSPFEVGCELCQVFCLGVIAQRLNASFHFDRETKHITDNPFADALLTWGAPRKGWEDYYSL